MGRLRKRLAAYRRKWGLFGLLFPLIGSVAGIAILWVSLYYGLGFDLIAWVLSPKGAPLIWVAVLIALGFVCLWCGA